MTTNDTHPASDRTANVNARIVQDFMNRQTGMDWEISQDSEGTVIRADTKGLDPEKAKPCIDSIPAWLGDLYHQDYLTKEPERTDTGFNLDDANLMRMSARLHELHTQPANVPHTSTLNDPATKPAALYLQAYTDTYQTEWKGDTLGVTVQLSEADYAPTLEKLQKLVNADILQEEHWSTKTLVDGSKLLSIPYGAIHMEPLVRTLYEDKSEKDGQSHFRPLIEAVEAAYGRTSLLPVVQGGSGVVEGKVTPPSPEAARG